MRKTFFTYPILFILCLSSCKKDPIEPFELLIADYNYSAAHSILYKLTNDNLTITYRTEIVGEKNDTLFSSHNLPKERLREISEIDIDTLSAIYTNGCVDDGLIHTIQFNKNGKSKTVRLENYYHAKLYAVIDVVNQTVPEKIKIRYDEGELIEGMQDCPDLRIIKEWAKE